MSHTSISCVQFISNDSLAALYFVGGVRVTFSTGIAAGGNLAYWTSYIITCVFTFITAAVIAETCSSLPSAGSIYLWAAEAGGPKYGRLMGFIVAWVSFSKANPKLHKEDGVSPEFEYVFS